jgi:hypothetical protein
MPRKLRRFQTGYAYHVTVRCNNREFKLQRLECREVFLYAIKQAIEKYKFKLYAVCIMSNHIHYLIEPRSSGKSPTLTASPTACASLSPSYPNRCQVSETSMIAAIAEQFIQANQAPRREEREI